MSFPSPALVGDGGTDTPTPPSLCVASPSLCAAAALDALAAGICEFASALQLSVGAAIVDGAQEKESQQAEVQAATAYFHERAQKLLGDDSDSEDEEGEQVQKADDEGLLPGHGPTTAAEGDASSVDLNTSTQDSDDSALPSTAEDGSAKRLGGGDEDDASGSQPSPSSTLGAASQTSERDAALA